ncbi:hypothetical protein JRO89_XS07G0041500 [Xanthoceras sorbifolium]|uniref:Uncharacterized protein n=1 Tax=Xanthoceras sorbifolium TaxID=99658 RepID=A0ABQ8HSJ2_9ROSI|nr:hypothetical protein JRO89_XS07G0041500 [Xanthoceras sorbifolium]
MTVKELEEKFEILSQQFEKRIEELSHQSVETQELLRMIGERLGRMEANNVGQQQPIHRNQFPIGLRPQQAEGALVQPRNIRIAFLIFSGDNPSGWVFRCEQYQRVTALTEAELLSLATVHLEGDAEELVFVANRKTNYRSTFTRSSSTFPGPSQLASTSRAHTSSTPSLLGPVPPGLPPYRRLSAAEQAERRTKGLCFNCDEQFKPGHRCKTPQLLLLEADAAEDAELEDEYDDTSPTVEISLKALTGLSLQNTMRLKGSIKKHGVTILVDSGSTHNFLNPTLAKQCGCKVTFTDQFRVTVGDGGVINSSEKCYDVPVSIQGFQFQLDFYLLPVSGCDIVLGAEWLQSLGNGSSPTVLADQGEFKRLLLQEKQSMFIQLMALTREDTKVSLPPIASQPIPNYSFDGTTLRYKGRFVVPSTSPWCYKILEENSIANTLADIGLDCDTLKW